MASRGWRRRRGCLRLFAAGIEIALVARSERLFRLRPSEQRHVPLEPVALADVEKMAAVEEVVTGLA